MAVSEPLFKCLFCSYRCLIWRDLNRHNFVTHLNEPLFLQRCIVTGCSLTFRSYSSFNSHLFRKHRGVDLENEAKKSLLSNGFCESERISGEEDIDVDISNSVTEPMDFEEAVTEENEIYHTVSSEGEDELRRSAAFFCC